MGFLYRALFSEQQGSSSSSTSGVSGVASGASSNSGDDMSKAIKTALEPIVAAQEDQKKSDDRITSYLDQVSKGQKNTKPPTTPSMTATSGTSSPVPSKPPGMTPQQGKGPDDNNDDNTSQLLSSPLPGTASPSSSAPKKQDDGTNKMNSAITGKALDGLAGRVADLVSRKLTKEHS